MIREGGDESTCMLSTAVWKEEIYVYLTRLDSLELVKVKNIG